MIYDLSFNICFIGTYSFTIRFMFIFLSSRRVLILVLLELILLQFLHNFPHPLLLSVLILVLLELILLPISIFHSKISSICFNPCFIGTYSFTRWRPKNCKRKSSVLILVLLELILLLLFLVQLLDLHFCFNPCFIGTYSFTIFNLHKYNILDIVLILVLLELILLH